MAFTSGKRTQLMAAAAVLLCGAAALQHGIDPLRMQPAIEPPSANKVLGNNSAILPFTYLLGASTGFRQVIAGLLWVRTDAFFHSGNYDAVLPMIRMITWLDPNWTDVYSTGAWHLMYNFTDTDQRSDRRYLGPGMALLNEGIANNANNYVMYKEKGWNAFDKLKDYSTAVEALQEGEKNDPKYDVTQLGHLLAHSLEKAGRTDEAIKEWQHVIDAHKAIMADPKASQIDKAQNEQGLKSSINNHDHLIIRQIVRKQNTQPPIDIQFTCKITRVRPKVLRVEGTWRSWGTAGNAFDMGTVDKPGTGLIYSGPTDGARVDVRLQDEGYKMATPKTFSFDIDESVTLMQDQISTRDGKLAQKGCLFTAPGKTADALDKNSQTVNIYSFTDDQIKQYGLGNVPLSKGLSQLTAFGRKQAAMAAYPIPFNAGEKVYTDAEAEAKFAQLKTDTAKLAELDKKHYCVSQKDAEKPGEFSREIDMSKDPKMYSFGKDKYEMILSLNPRNFPDDIQDRMGGGGEGLTDKNYLYIDKNNNNLRMMRRVIVLTKDDLTGAGEKVLVAK